MVFDTPATYIEATATPTPKSGATAVMAAWGMVVLMAAVALQ